MRNTKTFIQIFGVAFIAFAAFFFIYQNIPSQDGIKLYFTDIFNSLMGAMVVALVTASIFIFQRKIEADDEKNRVIYEKKLSLYEQIASTLNHVIQDSKISEKELEELQLFFFKVVLIAGPKAAEEFNNMLINLKNCSDSEIDDETMQTILNFITLSRMDLDVLADIDTKQREEIGHLLKKLSEDRRVVQNITRKKRTFTDDFRKQVLKEYDDASSSDAKDEVLRRHKLYQVQLNTFRKTLKSRKSG
jgi:hypothetical protein